MNQLLRRKVLRSGEVLLHEYWILDVTVICFQYEIYSLQHCVSRSASKVVALTLYRKRSSFKEIAVPAQAGIGLGEFVDFVRR